MESDQQFMRRLSATYIRSVRDLPTRAEIDRYYRIEREERWTRILKALRNK